MYQAKSITFFIAIEKYILETDIDSSLSIPERIGEARLEIVVSSLPIRFPGAFSPDVLVIATLAIRPRIIFVSPNRSFFANNTEFLFFLHETMLVVRK